MDKKAIEMFNLYRFLIPYHPMKNYILNRHFTYVFCRVNWLNTINQLLNTIQPLVEMFCILKLCVFVESEKLLFSRSHYGIDINKKQGESVLLYTVSPLDLFIVL